MQSIPNELVGYIQEFLNDDRDKVNLSIALSRYDTEFRKPDCDGNKGGFSMVFRDANLPIYQIWINNDYSMGASDGFCYASAVAKPFQAVINTGFMIETSNLLKCFHRFILKNTPRISDGFYWNEGVHINWGRLGHIGTRGRELHMMNLDTLIELPVHASHFNMIQDIRRWRMVQEGYSHYGSSPWVTAARSTQITTGNFSLADLALSQTLVNDYHCPPQVVYQSTGHPAPTPTVTQDEEAIIVVCEGIHSRFNLDSQDIGKIPHEYVANKLRSSTDLPLSLLGITGEESVLTPDFIDTVTKRVLELGTNQSESIKSLQNDFEGKVIKYDYLLKPIKANCYYLIVGSTSIVTNMFLSQNTVNDLCARFKVGVLISSRVSEILGYNVNTKASNEDIRIAKSLFRSMKPPSNENYGDHYNIRDILSIGQDPSDQDYEHSKVIMKNCLEQSKVRNPIERTQLNKYLSQFPITDCQTQQKRITNIPMLLSQPVDIDNLMIDAFNSDMPQYLKTIWNSCGSVKQEVQDYATAIDEAMSTKEPDLKHRIKKMSIFKPALSESEKIELAKSGVGAKYYQYNEEIKRKEAKSKRSFSPDTKVLDIDDFINDTTTLMHGYKRMRTTIERSVVESKLASTLRTDQKSIDIWKSLIDKKLVAFFDQVSEIFQELALNYKHWTVADQFMMKRTRSGIMMVIRNTGSHIFVSFAYPKRNIDYLDTGRLGPTLYSSNNYIFTEFSSFNEPTLEHFMKAGPYMSSLLINLMSNFKVEPGETTDDITKTFNFISLLYLNNKTDSEELLTSQRYLFMKLFEDATQDPYIFIDRLPDVLRSRLSVYILGRTIKLMDYYKSNRILKIPHVTNQVVSYDYLNIKSLITDSDITINQKINEFYYGYVISKERGRGSDRNFKIIKKILQEEYKFRDSVKNIFTTMTTKIETYCTDPKLLRVFLHVFKSIMEDKIGKDYSEIIENDFYNQLSFTNFTQLATLKASARYHDKPIDVPINTDDDRKKLLRSLNDRNKEESSKRPKVLEALLRTTKLYVSETGRPVKHMMQLIPWSLLKLEGKGYFDSDIFPKPQHGGDREIHVLEIMARLVQYTVELISRVICKYFISETITHPETKQNFVKSHYKLTSSVFTKSFVVSKSADASKWCQRHHVSHFAAMMVGIAPKPLENFILRALSLWTAKKISFPLQLVATLLANKETFSTNETFVRFRSEFFSGSGVFSQQMSNKIEIQSGMMQGILHYTSSLYHTLIQEVMKVITVKIASRKYGMNVVCTIVQGSDDSGMMLGVEGSVSKSKMTNVYSLLRLKEEVSNYLSVYWNVCKSSIGTIDLIEYNSEWHLRHQTIKPTFRWISACLEISVTERFIDRIRMFNQLITDCLEGGASTLECAVIQLNQCWMHYMLIGLNHSILADDVISMLLICKDPSLGFFPCDFDLSCGIAGVDCLIYNLASRCGYDIPEVSDENKLQYDFEGSDKNLIPHDLRSVKLKFGKMYLWKSLVERLDLGTLESAIQEIEDDPLILFGRHTSWDEELPNLIVKIFSPGVKESINNISSTLRLMAASAYLINKPCLSIFSGETLTKVSLYKALRDKCSSVRGFNTQKKLKRAFPLSDEYETFIKSVISVTQNSVTFTSKFTRSSKEKIIVFEIIKDRNSLLDLCKRKWSLGGKVALSSRQFIRVWEETKERFPFLRDSIKSTATELKMSIVEVKNFLESLESKSRSITLYDSAAKHGGIMSALTRIYWPDVKVRSDDEKLDLELTLLRSSLFSITTFWYTDVITAKLVSDTIKTTKSLRKPFKDIPYKYRKLKTIFDWMNGKSKIELIEQIQSHKQGIVGYFSQIQSGYGFNRVGYGLWVGQVIGIPVRIHMMNANVQRIEIKYLNDVNILGHALSNLINEFKCSFGKFEYSSNLWLSSIGKIITKKHDQGLYIPIWIKPDLRVDVINNMELNPWSIQVTGTTIRLVMTEAKSSSSMKYTILSESLSQRDWMPEIMNNKLDKSLREWNSGKSISINDLETNISDMIPDNLSSFPRFIASLHSKTTPSGWSLSKLRMRMMANLIDSKEAMSINNLTNGLEDEISLMTMEEVNKLMFGISSMPDEELFQKSNLSWADEAIEEFGDIADTSLLINDITPEIEKSLKNLAEDLADVYTHPDKEQQDDMRWMKMSQTNKFFSNLDKLSEIQTNLKFFDLYHTMKSDQNMTVKGILGKVISLMLMRHVVQGEDTNEYITDLASESSRQVNTILSETELESLDLNNLESTISQLEIAKAATQGTAGVELSRIIDKYKRLLLLKMSPTRTSDLEDIDYNVFMNKLLNFLFKENRSKFSKHEVDQNIKLSLIKLEMIEFREKQLNEGEISNHEFTLIREHLNKNSVSQYLVDSICECFRININLGTYRLSLDAEYIEFEL